MRYRPLRAGGGSGVGILGLLALITGICATPVQAQNTAYSNVTNFSGQGFINGGATVGTPLSTVLVADDINLGAGIGGRLITSFQFTVANFNTTTLTIRPTVSFYAANGAGSGPGTLLAALGFNPISVNAGNGSIFTFTNAAGVFMAPASGSFWAGVSFDNGGTSTATTAAQVNNFGQLLFNPPTVGTSSNVFFVSTNTGVGGTSNPAGGFFNLGTGGPVANFGWSFTVAGPEPASGFLVLGVVGAFGVIAARRRR